MNAMVYIRGNRADFDEWAAMGAEGWSYDEVLPYFKKSEDNERGEDQFHGVGGPLPVRESRSMTPVADVFVEAAAQAGHERNPDFNGARQEGFGRYQTTQENGMRASTSVRYLHPNMDRENLTVLTDALALRLLFDGDRASGVEIDHAGTVEEINAAREVIVSAGSYQSPQLLMLSGIGPAEALTLFGLEVRQDLPVGEGLQDHCMTLINWKADFESLMTALTPENIELLQSEGRGPLSSNVAESGGFIRTRPGLDAPDCQFHFAPVLFLEEGLGAAVEHGLGFGPGVVKPTSRGAVTLRTASPYVKPRIQHNYLTTEEDRATMLAGVEGRASRSHSRTRSRASSRDRSRRPTRMRATRSCGHTSSSNSMTIYHPTSSCAIGPVVDSAPEGPRRGRPARRRRLGDADDRPRQHQRGDDHDRREGCRSHQGGRGRAQRRLGGLSRSCSLRLRTDPPAARGAWSAHRDDHVAGEQRRLAGGCGWKFVPRRRPTIIEPPRIAPTVWPTPSQPSPPRSPPGGTRRRRPPPRSAGGVAPAAPSPCRSPCTGRSRGRPPLA